MSLVIPHIFSYELALAEITLAARAFIKFVDGLAAATDGDGAPDAR